jgi:hypothetical protein
MPQLSAPIINVAVYAAFTPCAAPARNFAARTAAISTMMTLVKDA